MKILFIGTVEFSLKALEKLVLLNANIIGVCTKEASSTNSDYADLAPVCIANRIPYKHIQDINSQVSIEWIQTLNPDIIFCFGWSALIKRELLGLTSMGVVGYHPAKLPQNRGRHPLIWAIALGLTESASTFFFMNEGADDGNILSQEIFEITCKDDAGTVYQKVIDMALLQIEDFLPKLQDGTYQVKKQDHSKANVWRKRGKKDGLIDFRMSSHAVYNLVRSLTKPYIGAHLEFKYESISIWKVEEIKYDKTNIEPGKILAVEGHAITVKTYDGAIRLVEHEFRELPKVGEYL